MERVLILPSNMLSRPPGGLERLVLWILKSPTQSGCVLEGGGIPDQLPEV